ncbi:MAG TPA: oligoendopeptidase F [Firmicutes bacterium]|nr:oligoendopeptidase F [Bacillota bacterium]
MERKEVETQYRWKTEDIFGSDEAWEAAFAALETLPDVSSFRGNLNTAENVAAYFALTDAYEIKLMRVYLYAFLKHDEDVRVTKYNAYVAKVMSLFTRYGAETSFAVPELTALPEETLAAIAADERLKDYDYSLKRLIARKKYVLSEKEELILAQTSEPLSVAGDVFDMLDDAELNLPYMVYQGKRVRLSHGLYSVIMSGSDREARAKAFKKYYSAYEKIINTLATTYYGNVKKDIFYKNVRGYESCLQAAIFEEDVSRDVYDNLVSAVDTYAPVMHRYMEVRKKTLGLDEMHMYDLPIPLVEDAELRLSFEDAFELVLKGLSPLGEEYNALLRKGRDERWIDVCETEGKRGGAYSIGIYGNHPYVLLNYQQTTHDVFTIAHEMGHALHSYFSNANQPYAKADYKIFVAEVASTVNEVLLLKYLLHTTEDKKLKKYLLNYFMDMIRTTLFRQTQFACFEQEAHAMAERGEPLNKDNLSALYYSLNKKYYGDALTHDKQIAIEWARIPHFYRSFYVYKYATGITAAIAIAGKILSEGKPAVERYFEFLKGGCSTDPVSLLKGAGADLTDKETFASAMREFETALAEFESLE